MEKRVLIIIAILFITASSFAQQANRENKRMSPEERIKKQTERLAESLNLNQEQTENVQVLNEKYSKKMKEILQKTKEKTREGLKEKADSLNTTKDAEMKEILTEEQFVLYQELQKKRKERMQKTRGNRTKDNSPRGTRGKPRGNRQ